MVSTKKSLSKSAFLWKGQNQWLKPTHIIVHQKNRRILTQSEFMGSFDASWSEWSWMIYRYPNHPKETHPQCYGLTLSHLMELSDTGWITVQQSPISFQRHEKPGLQCTALFKTRIPRRPKNKQNTLLSYTHHSFIPIKTVPFCFPNLNNA